MIKAIVSDFSKTILFPKDPNYKGKLNDLHEKLTQENPNYNFWNYFTLNQELIDQYKKLSNKIKLYIFTTKYIQEYPPIKSKLEPIFTQNLIAKDLNLDKDDPNTFDKIAKLVKRIPEEIIFIDDKKENIDAAKNKGFNVIHHINNQETIKRINNLIK